MDGEEVVRWDKWTGGLLNCAGGFDDVTVIGHKSAWKHTTLSTKLFQTRF